MFFFKQKTAYERRISDCSSDVCSSDLLLCLDGIEGNNISFLVRIELDGGIDHAGERLIDPELQISLDLRVHIQPVHRLSDEQPLRRTIGSASCRESVCQYVLIPVGSVSLTNNTNYSHIYHLYSF